nr:hypothetical protein [Streptomyces sp. SBT349]
MLTGAAPTAVAAPPAAVGDGWEPAPSAPWDMPAGARCDAPVHGEPVVDEVVRRVLDTHADGSPRTVVYRGDLVVRVTNTETGASHDADAGGAAVVEYAADGSESWSVLGPVLVGVAEGGGNLARGLYIVDGVWSLDIDASGHKTVTMTSGDRYDICSHVDRAS